MAVDPHPSDAELERVFDTMKGESHRGCVLVGAALIEWQMGELLTWALLNRHDAKEHEAIRTQIKVMLDPLHEKSILASAAARARMCRVLGLATESDHELIKRLLRFRNHHFAHFRGEAKLNHPAIKNDLEHLRSFLPDSLSLPVNRPHPELEVDPEHAKFMAIVIYLYFILDPRFQDGYDEPEGQTELSSS